MSTPVLFYDGGCGLCHGAVRLLLRLDAAGRLRFAPLGGATFNALVPVWVRAALPDSLVLRTSDGGLLLRSRAVVAVLRLAGGKAAWLGGAISLLPAPLADRLYDVVARGRRRLFASPRDACPVPPGPGRGRFLP